MLAALAATAATAWPASANVACAPAGDRRPDDNATERGRQARDRNQPQLRPADPDRRGRRGGGHPAGRIARGRRRRQPMSVRGRWSAPCTVHGAAGPRGSGRIAAADRALFAVRRRGSASTKSSATCPSLPRLDSAGNLSFRFGGRLGSPATPMAIIAAICRLPLNISEPSFGIPSLGRSPNGGKTKPPLTKPLREAVSGYG